jgi:integrase
VIERLTQKKVNSLKYDGKQQSIADGDVSGLMVYVGAKVKTWYLFFRDKGKRVKHKIGSADVLTVEQARADARDLLARLTRGENVKKEKPAGKLTLGNFFEDHYFPHLNIEHKSAKEIARALSVGFKSDLKKPIEEINMPLVDKWRNSRRESGLKYASINRTVAYLKAALNWGVKDNIILQNPIARITPFKERDSVLKVRYLTPEERERLESALIAREDKLRSNRNHANEWRSERSYTAKANLDNEFVDYLRPAVLLSLATGIRQGALFALVWGDIDFDAQTITLRGEISKNGKTQTLPMIDDAAYILNSWRSQCDDTAANALIFRSPKTGGKMQEIKTAWRKLLTDADIHNFRWHDMRHDFASHLVMAGVDLNTVRELMCHATMAMTIRYAHLAPENKLRAAQVLNRITHDKKVIGRIRKASA